MIIENFGITRSGDATKLFTLENSNGMKLKVTDYGATLVGIEVPKNGLVTDVVLGYDSVQEYESNNFFFGANVGRNANRIAGAKCTLDGVQYLLEQNNNENNLHSGCNSFPLKMWAAEYDENVNDQISFNLKSADLEQGFPGNMHVKLTYTLTEDNLVKLDYSATTDKTTVANFTNHSYFNLSGAGVESVIHQKLMINADYFTPVFDNKAIPTGKLESVKDTPMDFTEMKEIGKDIEENYPQLIFGNGYDHNYVINGDSHELRLLATAKSNKTGITMEIYANTPGAQLYTPNFKKKHKGKKETEYYQRAAFCIEPQYFPNAINEENFESPILKAGETYNLNIRFKFM